mgnify:FL=1
MDGISKREYNKLITELAIIKQATNQAALIEDLVNEKDAARLLECSVKTLQNHVYRGSLVIDVHYTQGIAGKRFYKKTALMGIQKTA